MAKHRKTPKRALRKRAARSLSVLALTATLVTGPMAVLNNEASPALASVVSSSAPLRVTGPIETRLPYKRPISKPVVKPKPDLDQRVVSFAKRFIGVPYVWGGASPSGFDCSGLVQYVYSHFGKSVPRVAQDQYDYFRSVSRRDARPGDLVFFHVDSDPNSYVYHVGILTGGTNMIAATSPGYDVQIQSYTWGGDTVTFGSLIHR